MVFSFANIEMQAFIYAEDRQSAADGLRELARSIENGLGNSTIVGTTYRVESNLREKKPSEGLRK